MKIEEISQLIKIEKTINIENNENQNNEIPTLPINYCDSYLHTERNVGPRGHDVVERFIFIEIYPKIFGKIEIEFVRF